MRRLIIALLLATLGSSALAADSLPPITPFKDVSRLVSIGGSLTEIIYALGEGNHLVARDTTGNYPEAATRLPDVGYMRALSPEGVLSVKPTAILAIQGSGPPDALAILSKAGVPYNEVPESFSPTSVRDKVLAVGKALGADDKARALAAKLDAEFAAVAYATAAIPARKRVLFVLSIQGGKIMAAGTHTAADGIIGLAGAINAITAYPGYKPLNDEAIIAARPDAILMMDNAGNAGVTTANLLANPAIMLTPAGQHGAVVHMDGEYLLGFGPRTPAAIRDLAGQLYPDLVAKN